MVQVELSAEPAAELAVSVVAVAATVVAAATTAAVWIYHGKKNNLYAEFKNNNIILF